MDAIGITPPRVASTHVRVRHKAGRYHSPGAGGAGVLRDPALFRLTAPVEHPGLRCIALSTSEPPGQGHGRVLGAGPGWQEHGQEIPVELSRTASMQGRWQLTDRRGHGFQTVQGFSGAPLFDDSMTVIWGMVQQVGETGQRVTLALGADRLHEALQRLGVGLLGRERTATEAAAQAPPPPTTIPAPDRCLGRDPDLAALVAALLAPGGTTALVLGEGGMGKTTLTREAANHPDVVARFGPRRHEAELAGAASAAALQDGIAAATGADPKQGMAGIRARLGAAPTLLLLDNLETPWEAEPEAVEALLHDLAGVPGLALMASLRGAESPRRPRWAHRRDLRPLDDDAARTLFRDIAHRIRPDDPDLPPLLAELGGLPLAIELVARQAEPDTGLARVRAAWRRLGPALADARADLGHRHASLARSIELSLDSPRLGEPGRHLFRLLGALPAGLAAAEEAALLGEKAPDAVRGLRAVGLAHERDGRLDLLAPVRRHAAAAHPPSEAERRGWVRHYLALTRDQGGRVGQEGGAAAAARLRPELANLDAALAAADDAGLLAEAIAATLGYSRFGYFLGLGGDGLRALAPVCRAAGARLGEANCTARLAEIALARSDHDAAREGFEAALPIFRGVGDVVGEAGCIAGLGEIAAGGGNAAEGRRLIEQAIALYESVGSADGVTWAKALLRRLGL